MSRSSTTAQPAAAAGSAASRPWPAAARSRPAQRCWRRSCAPRSARRRRAPASWPSTTSIRAFSKRATRQPGRAALEAARYLGQAIAGLIGALNIGRIVLDGPVTAFGDEWLATVADEARRRSLGAAQPATPRSSVGRLEPERRRPRRVGPADHARARPEPRPMTDGRATLAAPNFGRRPRPSPRRRRRRRQQGRRARRRRDARAIRGRHTIPTAVGEPDDAADHIAAAVDAALDRRRRQPRATSRPSASASRAASIRVTGVVSLAVNLGWHWLPLRDRLEADPRRPVRDRERRARRGRRDPRSPPARRRRRTSSTSASAPASAPASSLGGSVHRGTRGLAGEIGHIVVDADGPRCPCGLRGCLETVASGPAIARAARRRDRRRPASTLAGADDLDGGRRLRGGRGRRPARAARSSAGPARRSPGRSTPSS